MRTLHFPLPLILAVLFLSVACAQFGFAQGANFPVTASYGLDGLIGTSQAGSIYVTHSNISGTVTGQAISPSTESQLFSAADLGLPSTLSTNANFKPNIDAFANLEDVYPAAGLIDLTGADFDVTVEFSLTRDPGGTVIGHANDPQFLIGAPPKAFMVAEEQYLSDGAGSDTFVARVKGTHRFPLKLGSNHLGIQEAAQGYVETEVDALGATERHAFPVFFSVDEPTARALNEAYSPAVPFTEADILLKLTANPHQAPLVYVSGSDLGLWPGDNVDAIMLDRRRNGIGIVDVVFSLDRYSPSLVASPHLNLNVGASGLFRYYIDSNMVEPEITPWALPQNLGLTSDSPFDSQTGRDLDGVASHDPPILAPADQLFPNTLPPLPNKILRVGPDNDVRSAFLTVDGSSGGRDGVVRLEFGRATKFTLNEFALTKKTKFVVVARLGSFSEGLFTKTSANRVCHVGLPGVTDDPLYDFIFADSDNFDWGLGVAPVSLFPSTPTIAESENPAVFGFNFFPLPGIQVRLIVQAFAYPDTDDASSTLASDIEVGNAIELLWGF